MLNGLRSSRPAARRAGVLEFPSYSRSERVADGAVHLLGLAVGPLACGWLLLHLAQTRADDLQFAATAVYCLGLVGMLGGSAAYNLARPGQWKAVLRRVDHAMIFFMIAGTYTPFTVNIAARPIGPWVCGASWTMALLGAAMKLAGVSWRERGWLMLYLGLGWLILRVIPFFVLWFSPGTILLLLVGGAAFSFGSLIHQHGRLKYHNALWHALVLGGAALHFAAVATLLPPS